MDGDSNYFTRRANEERAAAMKAAHPKARNAHLQLARRYEELAGVKIAWQPRVIEKVS